MLTGLLIPPRPDSVLVFKHDFKSRPSADVILRSSDNWDFYVHKSVLSDASSVFEGMFALPQEPGAPAEGQSTLPVVPMQESTEILVHLFEMFYPGKGFTITTPSNASDLLAVADKYAMDGVTTHVKHILESSNFLEGGYLKVMATYGIARRYNFKYLAARAARASLKHPLPTHTPTELGAMPLAHYHELLDYRKACVALIDAYLPDEGDDNDDKWDSAIAEVWAWGHSERLKCNRRDESQVVILSLDDCSDCRGRLWLRLHLQRLKKAFSECVSGASVQDIGLIDKTVASIDCEVCLKRAPMELLEFSRRLGDKLDNDLLTINFEDYAS